MANTVSKPITLEASLALLKIKPVSKYIDGEIIQKLVLCREYSDIYRGRSRIVLLNGATP